MAKEISLVPADDDENDETNDALQTFLAEMGEGAAKVVIFRNQPRDKAGYVATWEIESVTLDRLASEYGPGEYRLRVQNSAGQTIKGGGRTVKISGDAKPPIPVAPPRSEIGISEILTMLNSGQDKSMAMLMGMLQSQSQAQQAQMQMQMQAMQANAQMMASIISAALGRPSESLRAPDLVAMLQSMHSMVKPPDTNAVETLMKGLELGRTLSGEGGEGGTDFLGLASQALGVIGSAVKSSPTPAPAPNPRPRRPVQVTDKTPPKAAAAPQVAQASQPAQPAPPVPPSETPKPVG